MRDYNCVPPSLWCSRRLHSMGTGGAITGSGAAQWDTSNPLACYCQQQTAKEHQQTSHVTRAPATSEKNMILPLSPGQRARLHSEHSHSSSPLGDAPSGTRSPTSPRGVGASIGPRDIRPPMRANDTADRGDLTGLLEG